VSDNRQLDALVEQSKLEHQQNRWYYRRFQEDNPVLAPRVLSYLSGDERPPDALIGQNHYARGLVSAEDALRWLREPLPFIPV